MDTRADGEPLSHVPTKILLGKTVETSPAWLAAIGAGLGCAEANDLTCTTTKKFKHTKNSNHNEYADFYMDGMTVGARQGGYKCLCNSRREVFQGKWRQM